MHAERITVRSAVGQWAEEALGPSSRVVGRESELAVLGSFLAEPSVGALVLSGGPGIGKTTLWEAAVEAARRRRFRVLSARPSTAEAKLSYAALADLLDEVDRSALDGVPAPQLRALEVALLRSMPEGRAPEPRAINLGFFNALRALAGREPLLVAIDDVQWLDRPSADALTFAARRLGGDGVRFLLTRRSGSRSPLERALEASELDRLELGPLSLGATRRILHERLGLSLPRHVLRRLFESSGGNPLFALELGRALAERVAFEIGDEIPVPDVVEDLLGTRVARLPAALRRLLLAVALSADPRVSQLAEVADPAALDDAVDAGLLVTDGDRVRPFHPLLAAAVRRRSRVRERRQLHVELARAAADEEVRARHLALATARPDAALAATVAAAASSASARGAAEGAVELAEHALRLTPPDSAERGDRLLALAEYLVVAGEPQRVTDLLSPELGALPRAAARGRAHLLLAEGGEIVSIDDVQYHLERALSESGGDPALRATVLARKVECGAVAAVERIREAEAWALEALPAARRAGPGVERLVLYALGWARILRGRSVDDLSERFRAVSDAASHIADSLDLVTGVRLAMRGNVRDARALFVRLLALAEERGEALSSVLLRLHLCELELRAGEWGAAARLLDEWDQRSDGSLVVAPVYERCRSLLAAGRGLPDEAERWAAGAIAAAEATGVRWDLLELWRALGIAALLGHEPGRAFESLRAVWEHMQREGVDDPGAFPVVPDLVEVLGELGELDGARALTDRLRDLAEQQEHPWGLATASRCDALVRLALRTYDQDAAAALARAADAYGQLGLRFDRARSLLALGRAQRRHRKWAAARASLEQATAAFDEIGSTGWAEQARSELARVGARRPQPAGELTEAERRAAELAAEGRSNKEIANALVVSVHTVEAHLSRAYAKLGVRSRTQLARCLPARG
jgi:DNA-binding NarL/FixJ family response regulator